MLCSFVPAGACVGAGVDLITAADLRFCSQDAYFSVKVRAPALTAAAAADEAAWPAVEEQQPPLLHASLAPARTATANQYSYVLPLVALRGIPVTAVKASDTHADAPYAAAAAACRRWTWPSPLTWAPCSACPASSDTVSPGQRQRPWRSC
jgi:hypothetical protein